MKIVLFGDPVLREKAKPVTVFHKKLHQLIDSIAYTLKTSGDGAALAANQVGLAKSIVVIEYLDEYLELVNPEIIETKGKQTDYEGCLSFPGYSGKVTRAQYLKVKYQDREGKEIVIERDGAMARCLQHEIDHLHGILFVDRMTTEELEENDTDLKIAVADVIAIADGTKMPITNSQPQ